MQQVTSTTPVRFKTLDQVEAKPVSYTYKRHIPSGMISLIVGRPGQGKSMFTAHLAAEHTRAGGVVIFSNREDSAEYVTRPRMEAAGADLSKVVLLDDEDLGYLPAGIETLRTAIAQTGATLVILDPVAAHLGVSVNNDQAARTALTPLAALAEETGAAIVLVHHTNKNAKKSSHAQAAILGGSGGLVGASRAIFAFGRTDDMNDEDRCLVTIKCNIGDHPKGIVFQMDSVDLADDVEAGRLVVTQEDVEIEPQDVLSSTGKSKGADNDSPNSPKKAMAAEWLTSMLASGPQKVESLKSLAMVEGLAWRTIRRAAEDLEIVKVRQGFGKGSHIEWNLPAGHPALKAQQGQGGN